MGTSSSNGGPSGKSSLLPSWYNDSAGGQTQPTPVSDSSAAGGNDQQTDPKFSQTVVTPTTSGNWKDAKGAFTRYTKNTSGATIRKAAKNYVRTLGGSRGATRSASRGISAGRGLISFLGAASSSSGGGGLNQTLTQLGLTAFIGHSSEEILAKNR